MVLRNSLYIFNFLFFVYFCIWNKSIKEETLKNTQISKDKKQNKIIKVQVKKKTKSPKYN